jgi:hypothetical protein
MAEKPTITEQYPSIDLKALQAPFDPQNIDWRVQRSGINNNGQGWVQVVAYIDNRAVQQRLDDVCGPENWRDEYDTSPVGGVLCGISIRVGNEWVTKWDGADTTKIEPIKGGLSNAEKRAAVKWGIGRYLYKLESKSVPVYNANGENYIRIWENGADQRKDQPKVKGYWNPPALPDWAKPVTLTPAPQRSAKDIITGNGDATDLVDNPPRGSQLIRIKALYASAGADATKRDEWMEAIKTEVQADDAIRKLQRKIDDKADQYGETT